LQATSGQPRLYGPDINLQSGGNFFVAEALHISQNHRFAVRTSQALQRFSQLMLAIARQNFLLRADRIDVFQRRSDRLLAVTRGRVQRNRYVAPPPSPPAPTVSGLINGDAIDPRFQVRVAAKALD